MIKWLDDILMYVRPEKVLLEEMVAFLTAFRDAGFTVNLAKSSLFCKEVRFWSRIVLSD